MRKRKVIKKTLLSFSLSIDMKEELDKYADKKDQSVAALIRNLIREALDQDAPKQTAKTKESPATVAIATEWFIAIIEDKPGISPNELWATYKALHGNLDDGIFCPAVKAARAATRVVVKDDYQPVKAERDPFA